MNKKPELLAPAGNLEKMQIAVQYGADAVYIGGPYLNLRSNADNFTLHELYDGIQFAHNNNTKVFITVNVFARNHHINQAKKYIKYLNELQPDAIIASDPAIILLCNEFAPDIPIHLSTQANCTNWMHARFWRKNNVSRINAARELSLGEIEELVQKSGLEVECFVHGAMCTAYSGRCFLSSFATGRSANLGNCAQPCRWRYILVEETRPGEPFTVIEDNDGSHIFNSKDLCLLPHIESLFKAGVHAWKIEGRMKSVHYVATVVSVYRQVIDELFKNGTLAREDINRWMNELKKISHRPYTAGFYLEKKDGLQFTDYSKPIASARFLGIIKGCDDFADGWRIEVDVKNGFNVPGDYELLQPDGSFQNISIKEMWDVKSNLLPSKFLSRANPNQSIAFNHTAKVARYSILREILNG